jgi:hypothetical protein
MLRKSRVDDALEGAPETGKVILTILVFSSERLEKSFTTSKWLCSGANVYKITDIASF